MNTSTSRPWRRGEIALLVFNGLSAGAAGIMGVFAVMEVLIGSDRPASAAAGYFVVRAVIFATVVVALVIRALVTRRAGSLPVVLLIGALIQFGDVVNSWAAGEMDVVVMAFLLGTVHATTAGLLRNR